jgi:hypothetical protein
MEVGECSADRLAGLWDTTAAIATRIAAECAEEA